MSKKNRMTLFKYSPLANILFNLNGIYIFIAIDELTVMNERLTLFPIAQKRVYDASTAIEFWPYFVKVPVMKMILKNFRNWMTTICF